jgi:HK97 family phage portal protein
VLRKVLLGDTQKALGPAEDTPNFAISGSQGSRRLTGATQRTHMQTYGGTDAIDWVMDCVDLYAQTGSNAQYWFHKPEDIGAMSGTTKPTPMEGPPDDLTNLFNLPNPYMDYTELLELSIIDLLVAGEFFWLKYKCGTDETSPQYGKPLALYRLSPALVEIVLDDNEQPDYVEWRAPGHGKPVQFKPEHIVHVKRPNPHDQWRGMSVIAASPQAMDIELAVTEAMRNYYDNGTWASGVLESDRTVPPSTWAKIKRQFRQLYQGKQSAGNVIMLERGLKYTPVSANATNAAYEEISKLSMDRIAKAFKVPMPLLGDVGGTDRLSVREAQRIFDNKVMRPFLNRIQKQVSIQLTQAWGLDYYIDHEYIMPIEDKFDLAEGAAALPGITVREVRGFIDLKPLAEIDDIEDGADLDTTVLNMPVEDPTGGEGGPGNVNRPLEGQPGRPPNGENVPAFPKPGDKPPANAKVRTNTTKSQGPPKTARELRREIRQARERLKGVQHG